MALAISTISNHKNNINQIYDNDPAKLNHKFPGTKKKIIGAKKIILLEIICLFPIMT